jgi:hypothetical protein
MRMIVVKSRTDLNELGAKLLKQGAAAEVALDSLKQLNPHVDFKKIEAGTILLVPDRPGFRKSGTDLVGGDAFDTLSEELKGAVDRAAARVQEGYDALAAERKDVTAAMKLAAFKRALEADPDLKPQAEEATQTFRQDQEQAKSAGEALKAIRADANEALDELARLLG